MSDRPARVEPGSPIALLRRVTSRRRCPPHQRLVDINTWGDTVRLQGKARVCLCNDCGETVEVPT